MKKIKLKNYINFDNDQNNFVNFRGYPNFNATVPIEQSCDQLISSGPGVYFFHDLRGVHYIGESIDIKSRFNSHIRREKNKKLVQKINSAFGVMNFSWVKTKTHMQALIFEKKWIRLFKPECNEITFKNS